MDGRQLLARVEQLVNDLSLIARTVGVIHSSLTERTQTQQEIAEKLAPVRSALNQVHTDASDTHAAVCDTISTATTKAKRASKGKSARKRR